MEVTTREVPTRRLTAHEFFTAARKLDDALENSELADYHLMELAVYLQRLADGGPYLTFWKDSKQGWVLATISSVIICIMELVQTYPVLGFNIPYMAYILLTTLIVLASAIAAMELFGRKKT